VYDQKWFKSLPFYGQKKKTSEMFQNIDIYMITSGNELHYIWFIYGLLFNSNISIRGGGMIIE